jgi:type IV pilus assembly protein PilY1
MHTKFFKFLLGIVFGLGLLISAQADMAQAPLLAQTTSVEPNLAFVFDDSGSMASQQMYQFGLRPDSDSCPTWDLWDGYGVKNPENNNSASAVLGTSNAGSYAAYSPDVNMMYYDPRVQYKLQVDSLGVDKGKGTRTDTSFKVYFHKPSVATLKVGSVTICAGGSKYPNPSGTMKLTFDVAKTYMPQPSTKATGTVAVKVDGNSGNRAVLSVAVTNAGAGYTTSTSIPTITWINPGSGTGVKYRVNMVADTMVNPVVNQKWNGVSINQLGAADFYSTGTTPGYMPDAGSVPSSQAGQYVSNAGSKLAAGATLISYPNTASSGVGNYPKFANRMCAGNGGTTCTWAEESQNYANWLLYHSTRVRLSRTGIGLAFKTFPAYDKSVIPAKELPSPFRLGWVALNNVATNSKLDAGVSLFTQARKNAFYTWLYGPNTEPGDSTPTRLAIDKVGQYFSRTDSDGPWGNTPSYAAVSTLATTTTAGDTAAKKAAHASCRRSNTLLLTDGYWNGSSSSLPNIDGTDGSTIVAPNSATYKYTPVYPKKDVTSNTLADVAMKYWVTDLRDLSNDVPQIIGVNESFWQNLTFYGIGLGVYGYLPQTKDNLDKLKLGTVLWPPAVADDPAAVDDMWHAAVNSGGSFLNAGDANSLTDAIENMLGSINRVVGKDSGVAAAAPDLGAGNSKYVPEYLTGSWRGNIKKYALDSTIGLGTDLIWEVVTEDPVTKIITSKIPKASARNIVVGNGATTGLKAVNFKYDTMPAALTGLMTGTVDAGLIDYLRGDASKEGDGGIYRSREAPLGDIVNSHPVFVKSSVDLLYDATASTVPGKSAYRAYVDVKKARAEGVLFVGANDGMLHAFRDGATTTSSNRGEEIFAYIPNTLLPKLSSLADKMYGQSAVPHKYYVDGRLVETDAYIGSSWANIVLGTTGAGGKAVFALQVPTDPLAVSGDNILWEINSATSGFGELGYVLSDVQTGVLPSGEWVGIFGNGFFSAAGSAQLFVVNLQTGAVIQKIDTASGPGNGLSGVTVVRDDSTKRIIGAYGGDLKGNLWKFDLSSSSSGGGYVGLSGVPLLAVGATQAMTAAPALVKHPSGGYMVVVGAGKFFEDTDKLSTSQQRVYGVWDSVPFGSTTTPSGVTQTGVTNLVQGSAAAVTQITWTCKRGWYINLPNSGERVVYPLNALVDGSVRAASMWPINVSTNICSAPAAGAGTSYQIKGVSGTCSDSGSEQVIGGVPLTPEICTGGGCSCSSSSSSSSCTCKTSDCCIGSSCTIDVPPPNAPVDCGEELLLPIGGCISGIQKYSVQTAKCPARMIEVPCPMPSGGTIKRQWRQLFMR